LTTKGISRTVLLLLFVAFAANALPSYAQFSVARQWNEALLQSIREDFARPTVHARNLFHSSIAMWDAWSAYDSSTEPYLLGNQLNGMGCAFNGVPEPANVLEARNMAISFALFRLLRHRFGNSPAASAALSRYQVLMNELGYDSSITSIDYQGGDPAALGNYIASCIISYGLMDGSNEAAGYSNKFYTPLNAPLAPALTGNALLTDFNRWQPLSFDVFIDQSGNPIPLGTPDFLGPEWGEVWPFALQSSDLTINYRDGNPYWVYHDPGAPPTLDTQEISATNEAYQWNFLLVAIWSSQLDPRDGVRIDISPATNGNLNINSLPQSVEELPLVYDLLEGGDHSLGRRTNPATGQPYWAQVVPRGDYARVLAEFWADGPDSETPPGHWFTILNYVSDNPLLKRQFKGVGPELDPLEWDVKSYFVLGGAMHDAAVSAWGIKGWYDYIRPISAIRGMARLGQSSDPALPRYHVGGMPLVPGFVEQIQEGDPLIGNLGVEENDIKIKAWRGPSFIFDPETDQGGVDWVPASSWWPYQRPTFVTPPFAGYVSGHSTFSRAAAEVLTLLTGDPYFPGGMGEFHAPKNEFLVFEEGPSEDVVLQWATYRDASDQCSLSRIWGGIHPPADDIPGRFIGEQVGKEAFAFADRFFSGAATLVESDHTSTIPTPMSVHVYPNPVLHGDALHVEWPDRGRVSIYDVLGRERATQDISFSTILPTHSLSTGSYFAVITPENGRPPVRKQFVVVR